MSSEGKLCISAGKAAGGIVRKTSGIRKKVSNISQGSAKRIKNICIGIIECPANTWKKLGNLCKTVKGRGRIARLEEKEKDVFEKIGTEAWNLYKNKVFDSIFKQENIKKYIRKLEGCNRDIQKNENVLAVQKEKMDRIAIFKRARANLESKNPRVRKVAILVLNKLGERAVIPYLNRMLEDSNEEVRKKAAEVIHKTIDSFTKETAGSGKNLKKMNKMMDEAEVQTRKKQQPGRKSSKSEKSEKTRKKNKEK